MSQLATREDLRETEQVASPMEAAPVTLAESVVGRLLGKAGEADPDAAGELTVSPEVGCAVTQPTSQLPARKIDLREAGHVALPCEATPVTLEVSCVGRLFGIAGEADPRAAGEPTVSPEVRGDVRSGARCELKCDERGEV